MNIGITGNIPPYGDFNAGYAACDAQQPFDETKNADWKRGYHVKEKERLIRSVRYHLRNGQNCCFALIDNPKTKSGTEYICAYYGCKNCTDEMLKDFIRLFVDQN